MFVVIIHSLLSYTEREMAFIEVVKHCRVNFTFCGEKIARSLQIFLFVG